MRITWFGHSAFRFDFSDKVVLIDPFFTGNPAFDGDRAKAVDGVTHIIITHGHGDHIGDAVEISKASGAKVITNYDLCMWLASKGLENFDPMNTGGTTDQGGFTVTLVRADHSAGLVEAGVTSRSAIRTAPSSRRRASPPSITWGIRTSSATWRSSPRSTRRKS